MQQSSFFYNTAPLYNHALKHSNFDFYLHYEQPTAYCNASTRRNRQRNVIWFNPPYSFLRLPDKQFSSQSNNMKSFLDKGNKIIRKLKTLQHAKLRKA